MDDQLTYGRRADVHKKARRISARQMTRRREALRRADAHSRIEGQFRSSQTEPIFEAFVRGEIELDDILPRIKALHSYPQQA